MLGLNLQTIVLNRRLFEIRIDDRGEQRRTIPSVRRSRQHGADEVRERRGRRQYGKRMLQAGRGIGGADQIARELEGGIEGERSAGSKEAEAVRVTPVATSDNDVVR